jgi:hypothetical protein
LSGVLASPGIVGRYVEMSSSKSQNSSVTNFLIPQEWPPNGRPVAARSCRQNYTDCFVAPDTVRDGFLFDGEDVEQSKSEEGKT